MTSHDVDYYVKGVVAGTNGPGGWACVYQDDNGNWKALGGHRRHTTSNRLTMMAVIAALTHAAGALRGAVDGITVTIHTKSDYVYKALANDKLQEYAGNNWRVKTYRTCASKPISNARGWKRIYDLICDLADNGILVRVERMATTPYENPIDLCDGIAVSQRDMAVTEVAMDPNDMTPIPSRYRRGRL